MRLIAPIILSLSVAAGSQALAQSSPETRLPEALDKAFREMMEELKPALTEMFKMIEQFEGVDDPRHYQMPEVLPNGDIIIRRRQDAPPFKPRDLDEDPVPDGPTKT